MVPELTAEENEISKMSEVLGDSTEISESIENHTEEIVKDVDNKQTESIETTGGVDNKDDLSTIKDEINKLRQENEELKNKILNTNFLPVPKDKKVEDTETISDEDFIGEDDLDELYRDSKRLNTLLNKVYKKGVENGRHFTRKQSEELLRSVPEVVKNNIALNATLKTVSEKFYADNSDLVPFKKVVGTVFEEVAALNTDKSYKEILPKVADEVRKRLDLVKKTTINKSSVSSLPSKKSGPRQTAPPSPDPLTKELMDMDMALNY